MQFLDLTKPIYIDFGKYPCKLYFMIIILILSFFSIIFRSTDVEQINKLPRDRNELTSIKNASLSYNGSHIIATLFIHYIYNITLTQHLQFLHLSLSGSGVNTTIKSKNAKISPKKSMPKEIHIFYPVIFSGSFHVELHRGHSFLCQSNFILTSSIISSKNDDPFENISTIFCQGNNPYDRNCTFSKICFQFGRFFWFTDKESSISYSFQDPLIQFNNISTFSGYKSFSPSLIDHIKYQHASLNTKKSLLVSINSFEPFSWKWIQNTAAPLYYILDNEKYEKVYGFISNSISLENISYLQQKVPFLSTGLETHCVNNLNTRNLIPSQESLLYFRNFMLSKAQFNFEKENENQNNEIKNQSKMIILENNQFVFDNFDEFYVKLFNNYKIERFNISSDPFLLIDKLQKADIVLCYEQKMSSQIFWMKKGKFIQLYVETVNCYEKELPTLISATIQNNVKIIQLNIQSNQTQLCNNLNNKDINSNNFNNSSIQTSLENNFIQHFRLDVEEVVKYLH